MSLPQFECFGIAFYRIFDRVAVPITISDSMQPDWDIGVFCSGGARSRQSLTMVLCRGGIVLFMETAKRELATRILSDRVVGTLRRLIMLENTLEMRSGFLVFTFAIVRISDIGQNRDNLCFGSRP